MEQLDTFVASVADVLAFSSASRRKGASKELTVTGGPDSILGDIRETEPTGQHQVTLAVVNVTTIGLVT